MVTKAIILGRELNTNKYTIRLPLFETAASQDQFIIKATVCCDDGVVNPFKIGDKVFVGFEDNYPDKPVILGKLSTEGLLDVSEEAPTVSYNLGNLEVIGTTKLSENTTIGNITYKSLAELFQRVDNLDAAVLEPLDDLREQVAELRDDVDELQEDVGSLQEDVSSLQGDVGNLQDDVDDLQDDIKEILWTEGNSYVVDNTCTYNKNLYLCIAANTASSQNAPTNTTYWKQITNDIFGSHVEIVDLRSL